MKVHELVTLLEHFADPEANVQVEGCDCVADGVGIDIDGSDVLVCRNSPQHSIEKLRAEEAAIAEERQKAEADRFTELLQIQPLDDYDHSPYDDWIK